MHGLANVKSLPTFRDNLKVPFSRAKNIIILDAWALKMGPIGCPKTSVRIYGYSLPNNPEERSSHLLSGGSMKSHIVRFYGEAILRNVRTFERLSFWILGSWRWDRYVVPKRRYGIATTCCAITQKSEFLNFGFNVICIFLNIPFLGAWELIIENGLVGFCVQYLTL